MDVIPIKIALCLTMFGRGVKCMPKFHAAFYLGVVRVVFWSLQYSVIIIGQLPRVSGEDPERIRVDSVVETSVLCLSANFLIFPSFILLFLYSTVQKSAVQYSYSFIKISLL